MFTVKWSRLVGEGRFWYGITCFYEEVCWNYEPKTLHFPLVVTERASSFFQLAELLFSFSFFNLFLFFSSEHERLGFSDIDKKNSKWDINDSLFALLLVFSWEVSGLFFCFTFDYNFVLEEAACCPSVSFFVKFLLVFQVSFGFSMVMRFKSLGSSSAFDFLSSNSSVSDWTFQIDKGVFWSSLIPWFFPNFDFFRGKWNVMATMATTRTFIEH